MGLEKLPPSPIEKLILNQLVLSLTAHTWALQNCMSFIPKMKPSTESGRLDLSKLFVFSSMAERVGFEFTRKRSFNNIERTAGHRKSDGRQW